MKWKLVPCLITSVLLVGCQQHQWAAGPGTDASTYGRVNGACKLASMGVATPGGFVGASGSPAFVGGMVGGAMLASAIGSAIRQNEAYNACLEANGFVAVAPQQPGQTQPQAAQPATQPVAYRQ